MRDAVNALRLLLPFGRIRLRVWAGTRFFGYAADPVARVVPWRESNSPPATETNVVWFKLMWRQATHCPVDESCGALTRRFSAL